MLETKGVLTGEIAMPIASEINYEHQLFIDSMRTGLQHAIRCGELLLEQKAQLEHGEWLPWVILNCDFTERTAQKYMRLASKYEPRFVFDEVTSIRAALRLLGPDREDGEAEEPEPVEYMFSWPKHPDVIAMQEAWQPFKTGINTLIHDGHDPITACHYLRMMRERMLEQVKIINAALGEG